MKNKQFLIVGGDNRMVELAKLLLDNDYKVATFGMDKTDIKGVQNYSDIQAAIENSNIIIGPIPFANDKAAVKAVYSNDSIMLEDFFKHIDDSKTLLVGAMNRSAREAAEKYNVKYIDYYSDEAYQIMNTIPTAEGAIAIMVDETDISIHNSNIMVLGYGRIGKLLSEYLKIMGANVFVEARRDSDLAWIRARNLNAVKLDNIIHYVSQMDIIVNTIPALVLDKTILDKVKKEALLLDLASNPGGIDYAYANDINIKTVHALSIPGKIAYKTAALYIYDTLIKLLEDNELKG